MEQEENSAIALSKYVKIKALSSFPFPGKILLLFTIFGLFLPENRAGSQVKGLESKFEKSFSYPHNSWSNSCKKILVPRFSSFATIVYGSQMTFQKNFNLDFQVWLLFLVPRLHFSKNELDLLTQNLMLIRLAPVSNPKNKKAKNSHAFF